jgi:hypothetical protein
MALKILISTLFWSSLPRNNQMEIVVGGSSTVAPVLPDEAKEYENVTNALYTSFDSNQ